MLACTQPASCGTFEKENMSAIRKITTTHQSTTTCNAPTTAAVRADTQERIEHHESLELLAEDQALLAASLSSPPLAKPALKRAFARHRELIACGRFTDRR
jgi:uncharacterized protein (DUF1778 family)